MFQKYIHLERFGTTPVDGINAGICHIFPKLDGTNASFWMEEDGIFRCASRNRELDVCNDNAGFMNWAITQDNLKLMAAALRGYRFFGEWLVPHSLKTYRDDVWRQFYLFDVLTPSGEFLHYDTYLEIAQIYRLQYIPCTLKITNPTYEDLHKQAMSNTFLLKEGQGHGEGIVIKQYGWKNRYGNSAFAKLITASFKEAHILTMGGSVVTHDMVEEKIVNEFLTSHVIDKIVAKIANEEEGGFTAKHIPRLLHTAYYDLITEEIWNAVKKHKNPKIDFKMLQHFTTKQVKQLNPQLFGI